MEHPSFAKPCRRPLSDLFREPPMTSSWVYAIDFRGLGSMRCRSVSVFKSLRQPWPRRLAAADLSRIGSGLLSRRLLERRCAGPHRMDAVDDLPLASGFLPGSQGKPWQNPPFTPSRSTGLAICPNFRVTDTWSLAGSSYLAQAIRVEPSMQVAA